MRNEHLRNYLRVTGACPEALDWIADRDLETAWAKCPRGDWMLWLAQRAQVNIRLLTAANAECAALAWEWMPKEGRAAVEAARAFARGEATQQKMQKAASAAASASAAAFGSASYAAYAAYAAASSVAYADDAAASGAAAAVAYADDDAATAAAYAAAYVATLKRCADIVRSIIPFTEIKKLVK